MRHDVPWLIASGLATVVLVAASALVLSGELDRQVGAAAAPGVVAPPAPATIEHGRVLFAAKGCNGCHALGPIAPSVPAGPDLTGLPAVAATRKPGLSADAYVRESLTNPEAFVVPGFGRSFGEQMPRLPLSAAEVDALVAFLLAPREAR